MRLQSAMGQPHCIWRCCQSIRSVRVVEPPRLTPQVQHAVNECWISGVARNKAIFDGPALVGFLTNGELCVAIVRYHDVYAHINGVSDAHSQFVPVGVTGVTFSERGIVAGKRCQSTLPNHWECIPSGTVNRVTNQPLADLKRIVLK